MTDEFDIFLSSALAPPEGEADRIFVARVQARIRVDQHLQSERRSLFSMLVVQVIGILAAAAAALMLFRSPEISSLAIESPEILLLALLVAFSFLVLMFGSSVSPRGQSKTFQRLRTLS